MNFSAVILAGGKSSRMGRDKAFLEIGGQTLLARQIQLATEIGAKEIFISGRVENDYSEFGGRVLTDKFPDAGPLAGIERALDAATFPLLLALAVDLPEMRANFLRRLAADCLEMRGVIPHRTGNAEPLAAFYPKTAHSLAKSALFAGNYAVTDFAARCVQLNLATFVGLAADEMKYFTNWNSPANFVPKAHS